MGTQTKIIVIKSKEIIYTGLFVILVCLTIFFLLHSFHPDTGKHTKETSQYIPGIYSSTITLGNHNLNVSVAVDANAINGVSIENLDETITTMYPLLEPALNEINDQITMVNDVDDITYSKENQYTYILLNQAIKNAIKKAAIEK